MDPDARLASVEIALTRLQAEHEATRKVLERVETTLEGFRDTLLGNGRQPGLRGRVERHEEAIAGAKWLFRTLVASVVTLAAATAWSLVGR